MTPFFSPGPSDQPSPPVFISAVNTYNCRVAGEVCDGVSLHPLCSPEYLNQRMLPNIADGAARAGRTTEQINLSGSSLVITGPTQAVIDAKKQAVKRQIAFYSSTRTYSPVLEVHGFEDVAVRLHEMSLKGQWEEMTGLITDEIFDAFAIAVGYDEVAPAIKERYGGLLDEVVFGFDTPGPEDENQLKKIIRELQD